MPFALQYHFPLLSVPRRGKVCLLSAGIVIIAASAIITPALIQYFKYNYYWYQCAHIVQSQNTLSFCKMPSNSADVKLGSQSFTVTDSYSTVKFDYPSLYWRKAKRLWADDTFNGPLLFCGECVSPAGHRRLVGVEIRLDQFTNFVFSDPICSIVLSPYAFNENNAQSTIRGASASHSLDSISRDKLEIFFGHLDPTDTSRFVIPYALGGHAGLITGRLRDDDQVDLDYASGPGRRHF